MMCLLTNRQALAQGLRSASRFSFCDIHIPQRRWLVFAVLSSVAFQIIVLAWRHEKPRIYGSCLFPLCVLSHSVSCIHGTYF